MEDSCPSLLGSLLLISLHMHSRFDQNLPLYETIPASLFTSNCFSQQKKGSWNPNSSRHKIWTPTEITPKNGWLNKKNLFDKTYEFIFNKCLSKKIIFFKTIFINYLNKTEPFYSINFILVLNSPYWNSFRTSVIFIFPNVFNWA